ncbi:hypothetical protein ACFLY5_00005, partial [Patescibacteria group bacterium]
MFEGAPQNPFESSSETPENQEETLGQPEVNPEQFEEKESSQIIFEEVLNNIENFDPQNEQEKLYKTGILENLEDIGLLLSEEEEPDDTEKETDMPSNALIAYRGLEQTLTDFPIEQDLGINGLKELLREKMISEDGFDVEEVEDMDMCLEQSQSDLEKIISEIKELDNPSQEKLNECGSAIENYLSAKKSIEQKQAELKKDSGKFYEQYSKKMIDSFGKMGDKLDEKALKNRLLKIIGEKQISSKVSKAAAIGLVALAGGLILLNPDVGETAETENYEEPQDNETEEVGVERAVVCGLS